MEINSFLSVIICFLKILLNILLDCIIKQLTNSIVYKCKASYHVCIANRKMNTFSLAKLTLMSLVTLRQYITPTELQYILYHLAATWKVFGLYLLMNKNNTKQNNTSPETPPHQKIKNKTINQQKTPQEKKNYDAIKDRNNNYI